MATGQELGSIQCRDWHVSFQLKFESLPLLQAGKGDLLLGATSNPALEEAVADRVFAGHSASDGGVRLGARHQLQQS
jgi:hypothetical protein